tara:strand:- start:274 stop:504 length:231 start_codon:yes stop_codon:yes gene_type:complete
MGDITKLTKKQLLGLIEESHDNKFDDFKEEFGITYNTEEEWIEFFKEVINQRDSIKKEYEEYKKAVYNKARNSGYW